VQAPSDEPTDMKSLATLLLASNPSAAFAPSATGVRPHAGQRSSAVAMRDQDFGKQVLAAAVAAAAILAAPHAAHAVAADMDVVTGMVSDSMLKYEAGSVASETIQETFERRINQDQQLLLPGLVIVLGLNNLFIQWDKEQPDRNSDFFDEYDSRRGEAIVSDMGDVGGGKWWDGRGQNPFGGRENREGSAQQGVELGSGGVRSKAEKEIKTSKAAEKAAKEKRTR